LRNYAGNFQQIQDGYSPFIPTQLFTNHLNLYPEIDEGVNIGLIIY